MFKIQLCLLYLILFLLPAYLVRFKFFVIPTTLLEILIYLAALLWFWQKLKNKCFFSSLSRIINIFKPFFWPSLLFLLSAALAVFLSPDKILSLGVLKGWFIDPLIFLILFLDLIKEKKQIQHSLFMLCASVFLLCLYGLIEYFVGFGLDTDHRLNSVYPTANFVALYLVPVLFFGLALFTEKIWARVRTLFIILFFSVCLLALYFTHSYGGWLALLAGLVYLALVLFKKYTKSSSLSGLSFFSNFFIKKWKKILLFAGLSCLVLVLLIFSEAGTAKFQRLFNWQERSALSTRLEIWQSSLLIISRQPFGVGLGNFEAAYRVIVPEIKFPPLEWLVNKAHNLYLNLWIETGWLGLASFLWLIYLFLKQKTPKREFLINLILNAAMLTILVHGLVDTPYFKNDLSVLFWVIIGLKSIISHQRLQSSDAAVK